MLFSSGEMNLFELTLRRSGGGRRRVSSSRTRKPIASRPPTLAAGTRVSSARCLTPCGGFTLIEVLVALFIVALGMGALLSTLTSSADTVDHLRDKSFAEWMALNRDQRSATGNARRATGTTSGEVEYAGTQVALAAGSHRPGHRGHAAHRCVGVAHRCRRSAAALATAVGFMGLQAISEPSGNDPDWTLEAVAWHTGWPMDRSPGGPEKPQ